MIAKIHHLFYAVALTVVGLATVWAWTYVATHPKPVVRVAKSPSRAASIEREVQAVILADRALSASRGSAPALSAPAVTVIRDIPGMAGFSAGEVAQILAGLKARTKTVVGAHIVGPKPTSSPAAPPGWTDAQSKALFQADVAATESVLANPQTHIAVTVSQQEVPPSRVGTIYTPDGSGLDVALFRRGHLEGNVGVIRRASHLSPILAPSWMIPHTSLAVGPYVSYDRRILYGISATVHF